MAAKKKTAKKKAAKKKPTKVRKTRKTRKKVSLKHNLVKAAVGLVVLVLLVVVAGVATRHYLVRKQPVRVAGSVEAPSARKAQSAPVKKVKVHKVPAVKKPARRSPTFEVFPEKELPYVKPEVPPPVRQPDARPRVALIIDDLGYDSAIAEKFAGLDTALTFSILPHSPFKRKIAEAAMARGLEVMLHLPMEPEEYPRIDPGPGALLCSLTPDELLRRLNDNLVSVPFVKGVNNHMGSRLTADSDRMNQIFTVLKQKGLFFVDSRTTALSVADQTARLFDVSFGRRDVFLDHIQDSEHIRRQLAKLVRYALEHGRAIGIGHPHRVTYDVLKSLIPALKQKVVFVPASQVVHPAG